MRTKSTIFGGFTVCFVSLAACDALRNGLPFGQQPLSCGPVPFTASNFIGASVQVDPDFVPALEQINEYATTNNVKVNVQNSFRLNYDPLANAIVTPSIHSNHMIGRAVDMNVAYGAGFSSNCSSACLGAGVSSLPAGVKGFIQAVRASGSGLRWGGDIAGAPDPVHIDDDFYNRDPAEWLQSYFRMRGWLPGCDSPPCPDLHDEVDMVLLNSPLLGDSTARISARSSYGSGVLVCVTYWGTVEAGPDAGKMRKIGTHRLNVDGNGSLTDSVFFSDVYKTLTWLWVATPADGDCGQRQTIDVPPS